jgi:hypothetical protein
MNVHLAGDVNATKTVAGPIGKYSDFPGVQISIYEGDAGDYLAMRGAQLAALIALFAAEGFEHQPSSVKNNVRWLASNLADEINHVIPIALKDAAAS